VDQPRRIGSRAGRQVAWIDDNNPDAVEQQFARKRRAVDAGP
jgi:hypothetical protein